MTLTDVTAGRFVVALSCLFQFIVLQRQFSKVQNDTSSYIIVKDNTLQLTNVNMQYYLVVEYGQNGSYFLGFPIILCLLNCMTLIIQHGHKLTFIQLQFIFVIPCAYFGNILLPFYFPPPDLDTVVVHPFGHIFICHSSFALTMTINLHYPPNGAVDPTYIQHQSLTDGKETDRTLHQQCLSSPPSPSPMHCKIRLNLSS